MPATSSHETPSSCAHHAATRAWNARRSVVTGTRTSKPATASVGTTLYCARVASPAASRVQLSAVTSCRLTRPQPHAPAAPPSSSAACSSRYASAAATTRISLGTAVPGMSREPWPATPVAVTRSHQIFFSA